MSSSPAISTDNAKPGERRASAREVLNHYVVLVYFGEDNWGKLTNMSEGGMAFEFSRPPALHERVNFTFQVMGCMPMPHDASVLGESFEAAGKIVWLQEFERIAGVQFVNLAEANRKHIRQWLAFEASTNTPAATDEAKQAGGEGAKEQAKEDDEETKEKMLPLVAEAAELPPPPAAPTEESKTASKADTKESIAELDTPESPAEPEQEPDSRLTYAMTEAPAALTEAEEAAAVWQPNAKSSPSLPPSVARLTLLVVSGCLAAFVVTAGVRILMARAAHRAEGGESALGPAGRGEPISGATVTPPGASLSEAAPPFQIEVLDENGKRWMLWFVRNDSKKASEQIPRRTEIATKGKDTAETAEPETPHTFTMVAPNLNRPADTGSAANNASAEDPAIQTEMTVPQGGATGGALDSRVTPPPPSVPPAIGGMVQQARLIHSVPPAYPPVAKLSRVSGDVVVDALIDPNGNVRTAKALSGPLMLQQAAIETVRQWKYSPARLDGQAVAMHLTVTVKFRLN